MQTTEGISYKSRSAILGIDIELYTDSTSPSLSTIKYEVSRGSFASSAIKQICTTNARFLECTDTVTASSLRRSAWFDTIQGLYTCTGSGCDGTGSVSHAVTISKTN